MSAPISMSATAKFATAKKVLIVGSAPDAVTIKQWDLSLFDAVVVINNAWRLYDQWDYHIYPEDFPEDRHPSKVKPRQTQIIYKDYVPAQNQFGGFVYAGGTMAFTAAYWVLAALKPELMAFIGCDMVYDKSKPTHFYGVGAADPLRDDITLQNLEAKATRLQVLAAEQSCLCVNLSALNESRLVFPKFNLPEVERFKKISRENMLVAFDKEKIQQAKNKEKTLNYFVESGEYWKCINIFDAKELKILDELWLQAKILEVNLNGETV